VLTYYRLSRVNGAYIHRPTQTIPLLRVCILLRKFMHLGFPILSYPAIIAATYRRQATL